MPDHVHLLIRLTPDQNISERVKTIKIASGKWLKQTSPIFKDFFWQNGYGAFSVSKSQIDHVKQYMINQKEHHKNSRFDDEWLNFLQNHDIDYNKDYVFG